ncbi:MAG: peptide-methionine (S)-S-oxide reductase MsrA [Nitrosopumilus sp.]|nr:peptide-methionine (S)-S-oxide reductase MsrA [Nitrosopumilus sp.]MDA7942989.1 peptide-methionine (S)-S-oxide reductase MsrA [Nitrosopumilus sp.]MDA7952237.1 peptide-methionine (S)-S-oxide reductase MsrA [Nitrosopumilus sp.]MDA7957818.1 peptide-methionine (S)-S-oxide reductase MsrA [Nitrosopumilus sp.]MDA7998346.1 peptide-methionine (S)-S-oxide reductase MsrA [Nitrosopumilus sp.]
MKATFGAGCFWHVEDVFARTPGVVSTRAGYAGGTVPDPTYEQVCTDKTGHAEAVEVEFDPGRISYSDLLRIFWRCHDPTTRDRQGPDVGRQYRSVIFCHSEEQRQDAEMSAAEEGASGRHRSPIVTEVAGDEEFYPAEEYHQRYIEKRR